VEQKSVRSEAYGLIGIFLFVIDFVLVWVGALAALLFSSTSHASAVARFTIGFPHHGAILFLYSMLFVLCAFAWRLYAPSHRPGFLGQVLDLLKVLSSAAVVLAMFVYFSGTNSLSTGVLIGTLVLDFVLLLVWRGFLRLSGFNGLAEQRNVLIIGAGAAGQELHRYLENTPQLGYSVKGSIDRRARSRDSASGGSSLGPPVLGSISELDAIIRTHFIDEMLITLPGVRDLVREVVVQARRFGTQVRVIPDLYDGLVVGAPIESMGKVPVVTLHRRTIPALQLLFKRSVDVVLSAFVLVAFAPAFAVIAILVKLDSNGPVFYNSARLGKKGKIFVCHKFRTMVADAEQRKESLHHLNERKEILFKISNDPRVTRLGRFLRKWSLDELPQLWNVLKGDMSLVGPRPPVPDEFQQYAIEDRRRLEVTPGLTGLWQVESRHSASFREYIQLDLKYIDSWSIWLDLRLILKTFYVVFAGTGR
jgi:exopolysaccharide biosynthesis polyprenyl glycosylphosphotransferase